MLKLKKYRKYFVVIIYKFYDTVTKILLPAEENNLVIKVILKRSLYNYF